MNIVNHASNQLTQIPWIMVVQNLIASDFQTTLQDLKLVRTSHACSLRLNKITKVTIKDLKV